MFKYIALVFLYTSVPLVATATESHCTANESVIWSCSSNKKIYSVCASKNLSASIGYMQYRVGYLKNPVFFYPEKAQHPRRFFNFELLNRAARLNFTNAKYHYEITDQLIGESYVDVTKNEKPIATVTCSDSTQTLTDTTSINLFKTIGINE